MFAMGCHHVKIRFYRVYFIGSSLIKSYGSYFKNGISYRNLSRRITDQINKIENHTVIYEKNYGLNQHNRKSYRKWCEILRFIFSELKFLP